MTHRSQEHTIVAIYDDHAAAESAVKALQAAGMDMKHLSIVGKEVETEAQAVGFYTFGDRMKFWGTRGALWGGLWGILFGGAFFFLPVIGPIVALGPFVTALVAALEGAVVGGTAGVFAAALTSHGVSDRSVAKYELAVKTGKFMVLARGTEDMIAHARVVLNTTAPIELEAHPQP
jgi:uncharacterized membrane protein